MTRWAILTGEYPPQQGGVADYTRLVATGLAAAGDTVTVYAPMTSGWMPTDPRVTVRHLPDHFGPRALIFLDSALATHPRPDRILIQYVPHMYGWKAMNVLFCAWLWLQRSLRPWVMFHEVAYPCAWGQRFRHNLLGVTNGLMAALVAQAAAKIFLSTSSWTSSLRHLGVRHKTMTWLPIPSNMPVCVEPDKTAAVRTSLPIDSGAFLIGHFGTFGSFVGSLLTEALPPLLRGAPTRHGLLIGRGSEAFAERLKLANPDLAGRLHACGEISVEDVAAYLNCCHLLLQPFPDGVSGRRTSLMAGLALGLPIVTIAGPLTEPIWQEEQFVALAPSGEPGALVAEAERLLADPVVRLSLGERARVGYGRFFSLENTIRTLRTEALVQS